MSLQNRPQPFDSPEVCVVEASAGSGKTYALAERYVRLILHLSRGHAKPPIHSILAITFTNKATFEMKDRIMRFLKELALGTMPPERREKMLDGLQMAPDEAAKTARRIITAILQGYNYFQVQTIDRFIRSLLVGSAFEIGLSGRFRVRTDERVYLQEALDTVILQAGQNKAIRQEFEQFLTSMLLIESRAAWIPREVVLDSMVKMFGDHNNQGLPFCPPQTTPDEIRRAKALLVTSVAEFAQRMPLGVNKNFAGCVSDMAGRVGRSFRFNDLRTCFRYPEIGMLKGKVPSPEEARAWADIHQGFCDVAQREVHHLCDPYIRIFERVAERFRELCLKQDVIFLSQLNIRTQELKNVDPLEMYYRLSTRFEHYLFDEFQDTSLLQWENLRTLPEDAIARGGSLFYVGDKKQAIYGFRGGDARLFDEVCEDYAQGYNLKSRLLSDSRRSHKSIVDFNNAVFSVENIHRMVREAVSKKGDRLIPFRMCDDAQLESVFHSSHQTVIHDKPQGHVCVEVLSATSAEKSRQEALEKTILRLQELKARGFQWKQIAILVRKNDEVARFTRGLLEAGISASSERTLNIKEHPAVSEIVAFLQFLDSPVENEAFAAFIQGDLFLRAAGLSADDVRDHCVAWGMDRSRGYLFKAFQEWFPNVWGELIEPFYKSVGLYPLYELLSSIYRSWKVLDSASQDKAFLMHFLGLVHAQENDHPGLGDFLIFYDALEGGELFVPADDAQAVTVTTLHKAKGLEYPVVILPLLTLSAQRDRERGSKAVAYSLRRKDEGLALYHFSKDHAPYSVTASEEYVADQMKHFFGELNAAYVALTRAEYEMYVFLPAKSGNGINLASFLIPESVRVLGEVATNYPFRKKEDMVEPTMVAPPVCLDWLGLLKDEFVKEDSVASYQNRSFGISLHKVLEGIKDVPLGQEIPAVEEALRMAGKIPDGIKDLVKALVMDKSLREVFDLKGRRVLNEQEIVDKWGHARRIDRMIVSKDEVRVIDYKTSRGEDLEESRQQILEYCSLLKPLYPGHKIHGQVLFVKERELVDV